MRFGKILVLGKHGHQVAKQLGESKWLAKQSWVLLVTRDCFAHAKLYGLQSSDLIEAKNWNTRGRSLILWWKAGVIETMITLEPS